MDITLNLDVSRTKQSRLDEVDFENLEFGAIPGDHMLIARYRHGEWEDARIEPFHDLRLSPFALVLHYSQTIFEGLKAFRMDDGRINVFRPDRNYERMLRSAERMCLPEIPRDLFIDGMMQLISLDRAWVPRQKDMALYIRPFLFASENKLGVKPADECLFMIVTSPVPPFYPRPLKVRMETHFVRAAPGGTGAAKCGGNYAGALYPAKLAKEDGFDQVIWTDACHHQFVEESGTMNLMFVIDGKVVTPPLSDSILAGITRDTLLTLARDLNIPAEERPISVEEVRTALRNGRLTEAFGAGTAAVVAPIEQITIGEEDFRLNVTADKTMFRLRAALDDIRMGRVADRYGWNWVVE